MKLFLLVIGLQVTNGVTAYENYITKEEFAALSGRSIPVTNGTSFSLPQYGNEVEISPLKTRAGFGPRLWTNAQVPYTLDPGFTQEQRNLVAMAIREYHLNTCIRFIPKQNHHKSWVDILYDANVCGVAQLCMNTGGQYAKFGGSCVNAGVIVHELGHSLCMGHEQSRMDRDEWISWNTAICQPHRKDSADFGRGLHKLYDYVSVEHYEGECYNGCIKPKIPGVTKCGSGGPLSVLDIEILNEMYGCTSGCLGYRYVNSNSRLKNPVIAGSEPGKAKELYSCRAYHEGDIIPGKYHPEWKQCHVAYNSREHRKTGKHIEILTNPNGANFQWRRNSGSLPSNAVRGGRTSERETLYVIRCEINRNGNTFWSPGKYQPSAGAYTSWGGMEIKCQKFDFLVCI